MRNIKSIAMQEIRSLFLSWRAYALLTVFLAITGFFFTIFMVEFSNRSLEAQKYLSYPGFEEQLGHLNINDSVLTGIFGSTSFILLFIIPGITMRLLAEEKRRGTSELLLTSPVTELELVTGKFFAGLGTVILMLLCTLSVPLFSGLYSKPDWVPVMTGYLGLVLISGAFTAIGLFFSSLTRNQFVAMIMTFGTILLFYIVGWISDSVPYSAGQILRNISLIEHFESFARGIIDLKDIVYYLSVIFLGIFLTHQTVSSGRWR